MARAPFRLIWDIEDMSTTTVVVKRMDFAGRMLEMRYHIALTAQLDRWSSRVDWLIIPEDSPVAGLTKS